MEIPASITEGLTLLGRSQFKKVLDERLRPGFNRDGLKLLRLMSLRERDVRELYRDRAPYELLQNADDVNARRATFVLTQDGLAFAHDGAWFTVANFISLAEGWSDKDPKQCIGHKGIGFRSVLDITPAPHVIKVDQQDFFGFKFTWALNKGHILETLRRHPNLEEDYRASTRHGQSACPVMAIPGDARKVSMGAGAAVFDQVARLVYGDGFTTFFWFPAQDRDADPRVVEELGVSPLIADSVGRKRLMHFVEKEVAVLLPLLSSLEEVSLHSAGQVLVKAAASGNRKSEIGDEVRVQLMAGGLSYEEAFFQMHAAPPIPLQIKNHPQTPKAVRQMDKASLRLSIRLQSKHPVYNTAAKFHVYFPTNEPTGFGFTVHGDFYVMPDRTRLMGGDYNAWLLQLAARKLAGDFLTQMLKRYDPKLVFESLRPNPTVSHDAGQQFRALASDALRRRTVPYVPTSAGTLRHEEVAIPSSVDDKGFWADNFGESANVVTGKKGLLDPNTDSEDARKFLRLAGMEPLQTDILIDLIEERAKSRPSAEWWYGVYSYLAKDRESSTWGHDKLSGRALLPDQGLAVISVPRETSPVLCLPPVDDSSVPTVPNCFKSSFVFLNTELSRRLHQGADDVRHWLLHACRIVQFEATDLLPRAIAANVRKFYDGSIKLSPDELGALWGFLQKIIGLSRGIKSDQFWQDIGRLPVPLSFDPASPDPLRHTYLAPAFLTYWSDGDQDCQPCVAGVPAFRRLAPEFVPYLRQQSGGTDVEWRHLLAQAGVLGSPKLLRYVRPVGGGREIPFAVDLPDDVTDASFSGERQRDESIVAAENLRGNALWREYVESFSADAREGRSLQDVTLVDRLDSCVQLAETSWRDGKPDWQVRLSSLIHNLPVADVKTTGNDSVFRRSRSGGGANEPIGSFLRLQLARLRWAPSTLGPVSPLDGFLRLDNRRFVSRGASEEDLGDLVAPYVVAQQLDDYARLTHLGFEPLEDSTASAKTLARFIRFAGERLSGEWARDSILSVRGRWRLVRGAIQEAYRALNQTESEAEFPPDVKFAARLSGRLEFRARPLYYAEPGSAIERAFADALPLFDADRVYQRLFERLEIFRLVAGQTVEEDFCGESRTAPSSALREAIVNQLGPYLLAVVIAKSEDRGHRDLILRRLRDRFDVQSADRLAVKFTLRGATEIERFVDFPKFYLRRKSVETPRAVREIHYTLYVVGRDDTILEDLDGDALGDAIAPVFFDGSRDDHSQLFPRVVSRFQSVKGAQPEMEEFLLSSLGISKDAQGLARDDISGKTEDVPPIRLPEPPPAVVVVPMVQPEGSQTENKLDEHKHDATKRLDDLLKTLNKELTDTPPREGGREIGGPGGGRGRISREQEARGRRGEEEFLRRISLSGGWMGFVLFKDTRTEETGYDFVCNQGEHAVRVEVKTFTLDGRIILSANELRAAALFGDDYYLVGFIDSGSEQQRWASRIIRNPLTQLLEKGKFDVDVKLQATAGDVFDLNDHS